MPLFTIQDLTPFTPSQDKENQEDGTFKRISYLNSIKEIFHEAPEALSLTIRELEALVLVLEELLHRDQTLQRSARRFSVKHIRQITLEIEKPGQTDNELDRAIDF